MNILIYILLVLEVICCFLLLTVILVQRSKSQGAGMAFGAGMGETMFGSQVGNILTRSTVILGISFLVITTLLAWATPRTTHHGATDLAPDVNPAQQQQPPPVSDGSFSGGDIAAPAAETLPAIDFEASVPEAPAGSAESQPLETPAASAPDAAEAPAPDATAVPPAE